MRVATYNIHRCVGIDGRYAPDRVAGVLNEITPDIVALQEVDNAKPRRSGLHQLDYLSRETGLTGVPGLNICKRRRDYGNALLTSLPVLAVRRLDLSVSGYEPRGAIDVDLAGRDGPVRVIATHLGLRAGERREQIDRLFAFLSESRQSAGRTLLMGDFNEWWLAGRRRLAALGELLDACYEGRSFPAPYPLLALERIHVHPQPSRAKVRVHAGPLARRASDHRPLVVDLAWPDGERP